MISLLPEELRLTSVLCAHLFLLFSGNSLLFLTNLRNGIKNQNGCSCQYTHVKKTNEKEFTAQSATTALVRKRYYDDVFCVWSTTKDKTEEFVRLPQYNQIHGWNISPKNYIPGSISVQRRWNWQGIAHFDVQTF